MQLTSMGAAILINRLTRGGRVAKRQYHEEITAAGSRPMPKISRQDQFVRRSSSVTFASQAVSTTTPQEKLSRMAQQLAKHQLDAYYIPPEDEHLNEYLPEYKKRIEWLTGFTGESAPALILPDRMHLYVDGRFHIQVDHEVEPSVVEAHKLKSDADSLETTLKNLAAQRQADKPMRVGYDPFIVSPSRLKRLKDQLPQTLPLEWVPVQGNLVDPTWSERPSLPTTQAFVVAPDLAGKSVPEKLTLIRDEMKKENADVLPLTRLDDVAWLYNIRGGDIPYNPVLESYGLLTQDKAYLFAPQSKIPPDVAQTLASQGVELRPYDEYQQTLTQVLTQTPGNKPKVLIDTDGLTLGTLDLVNAHATVVEKPNPVTMQKALKNPTEIEKMLLANFRASRAIIRHLAEVDKQVAAGKAYNEEEVRADLEAKYKAEPEFFDLSFPTIPGIGTNSAIIHYSHADPKQIGKDGDFYLLDSGCQYLGGTTDTTRTTVFGTPKPDQIAKFTAVLKAHIACASQRFPDGTTGAQLDAVCRSPMWKRKLEFMHGTGHGVGAFLNVHEGPNRISKINQTVFKPGMVTSIEPGYYEKDWGGIRLENLYYVAEETAPDGTKWNTFEPLTFVPFEKKLIDFSALNPEETAWLKDYYQKVLDKVGPTLSAEERAWLENQCQVPN